MRRHSLVVILAADRDAGAPTLPALLARVRPAVDVTWGRTEHEGRAACMVAGVDHDQRPEELRRALTAVCNPWRYAVTVAATTGDRA